MSDSVPLAVFIVDGDPEMNHHLRRALEGDRRWEVVGEAVSVQDVVDDVSRLDPDVVVLDRLDNPSREALPRIFQVCPQCMLTVVSTDPVRRPHHRCWRRRRDRRRRPGQLHR